MFDRCSDASRCRSNASARRCIASRGCSETLGELTSSFEQQMKVFVRCSKRIEPRSNGFAGRSNAFDECPKHLAPRSNPLERRSKGIEPLQIACMKLMDAFVEHRDSFVRHSNAIE